MSVFPMTGATVDETTSSNVGTGEGALAKPKNGTDLPFKTLKAGPNVTITNNADDVTIEAATGGGGIADGDKGDITVSGSGATWTIDNGVVSNAKLASMTTKTYKGRTAGTTGAPEDVAVATLKTDLALVKGDVGLGNVDNTSDVNKPISTATQTALDAKKTDAMATGKLLGRNTAGAGVIEEITLGTNLSFSGTTLNAAGGGGGVSDGDKGDITVSGSGATWTIDNAAVSNAKLADMTTKTYKGRTAGTTGAPEDVAVATLKTDLALTEADPSFSDITTNNVTSTKHGYAPKSPANAAQFLNGAATPAFAAVKDSDLSTSDITTNDASTSKHGFMAKYPNGAQLSKFLREDGTFVAPIILTSTTADFTGTNVNTAQPVFNTTEDVFTALGSTSYWFEGVYHIHTTGATSHTLGLLFGGTATLTSIGYSLTWANAATEVAAAANTLWVTVATVTNTFAAAAAASHTTVRLAGIVRINAGGTFIPQYQWSAAPGTAGVTLRNSYFMMTPFGTNTTAFVGSWA